MSILRSHGYSLSVYTITIRTEPRTYMPVHKPKCTNGGEEVKKVNEVPIVQFCLSEDITNNSGQVNAGIVHSTQKLSVLLKILL